MTDARAGSLWPWAAAAVMVGLAGRLALRIDYAEEVDSIRFLLALTDYDVAAHRPHFPGYPVFVALGRAAQWLTGATPIAALGLVCATAGALLALPVGWLTARLAGRRAAVWALWLVALNPFLWLYSDKLLSDMPGLLFLFCGLALLAHGLCTAERPDRWFVGAGLVLGLTLGVRLSYFPFVLAGIGILAWRRQRLVWPLAAGALGVCVWLLPMLLDAGPAALWDVALLQGTGHFSRWGGTVATQTDWSARAVALVWELWAHGLGAWWPERALWTLLPAAGVVGLLALRPWRRRPGSHDEARPVALWAALFCPYLVWVFLAQNILVKPRHALPLATLLLVALAAALGRLTIRGGDRRLALLATAAAALLLGGQFVGGWSVGRAHRDTPSNAVRLAQDVAARCASHAGGRPCVVYTASLQRHLARHAPAVEVVRVRRLSEARRDLERRSPQPLALISSDVARLDRLGSPPIANYRRSRYVQNARHELALYPIEGRPSRTVALQGGDR